MCLYLGDDGGTREAVTLAGLNDNTIDCDIPRILRQVLSLQPGRDGEDPLTLPIIILYIIVLVMWRPLSIAYGILLYNEER